MSNLPFGTTEGDIEKYWGGNDEPCESCADNLREYIASGKCPEFQNYLLDLGHKIGISEMEQAEKDFFKENFDTYEEECTHREP